MQPKIGKNLLLAILFASSGGQLSSIGINRALSSPSETKSHQDRSASNLIYLTLAEATSPTSQLTIIQLETPKNLESLTAQINQGPTKEPDNTQQQANLVQPTSRTDDITPSSLQSADYLLNQPIIGDSETAQRLVQQSPEQEESASELNEEQELRLRVRPRPLEEIPPPPQEKPVDQFQAIGYLRGYVGYFHSSNIFSTNEDKIEDSLLYSGLTLASAYFPLSPTTYLNGAIDGGLVRYLDQSQFDYNQVRFNLGIYQEISREMYAELNISNQHLFYANNSDLLAAGDRFLNENSVQLSLGRRDTLTDKLTLDSLYELSVNFSDPQRQSRIVNYFWLSLRYYLQDPLQIGLNYQLNLSDYTQRDREDQFHRLFGHLNYRASNTSNIYLQGGVNFGDSTTPNIDFSSWFFSVNYGFEIGRF
ncbi:hypothetical protein H6G06_26730 [Anabaena sphaerica FACHB-251]|uniref:Uncharacterized protein n=1 Tax=Anabaena sphaerica FACHB-251 TaxID=2692883 RepID=A0A926WLQ9_9NOST|nr:hypothetical protein [Anabaena sphaerica]MBD2296973.1 hypothetical protein [Anabaena sphaerica FACHB-251]